MKKLLCFLCLSTLSALLFAQPATTSSADVQAITSLVDRHQQARMARDAATIRNLLTEDVDQLVSSGEWRRGIDGALSGMQRSSTQNPGGSTLTVETVRLLDSNTAIADARYELPNSDGSLRRMWSTFVAVRKDGEWKITAIRNMEPSGYR
ncbi:hypothetical protein GCM10007205_21270 [Oxalicibacterium flavum]|uniref:DUF4440 domain-containing protein n=1 Tax=Oxalicibacterium flavum TaxID=179467 RepID=A0A8J2ULP3_9BURK|nr:SgcJ/EcaC family oxidoreductase [Oxalicibacterium flavum]GGC11900.1 hypothetical protein GCM10007205_21270 [Oxalicibacterium flavum]